MGIGGPNLEGIEGAMTALRSEQRAHELEARIAKAIEILTADMGVGYVHAARMCDDAVKILKHKAVR